MLVPGTVVVKGVALAGKAAPNNAAIKDRKTATNNLKS
jgi:hypothetical protein